MSGDESEWAENPMERDFYSLNFNRYVKGPGARIPIDRLPAARRDTDRPLDPLKLYVAQIPLDMTENGLRNYMSGIGCPLPTYMRLLRGKVGSTPHLFQYAFMTFETTRDAAEALQLLNRKEPYFFKVNFANRPGEKERMDKLRMSQLKEIDVGHHFAEYLKSKRTQTNQWQQCTTFTDDSNEATTPSSSGLPNSSDDNESSVKSASSAVGRDSPLQNLISKQLVKFLESGNKSCNYCSVLPYVDHIHYIIDEARIYNPLADLPLLKDVYCQYCDERPKSVQVCKKCRSTIYCCKSCQVNDWPRHSNDCKLEQKLYSSC